MSETVWVAYRDNGCEGKSEPLAVFATRDMADVFLAGAAAGYATMEVMELPLQRPTPTDKEQG